MTSSSKPPWKDSIPRARCLRDRARVTHTNRPGRARLALVWPPPPAQDVLRDVGGTSACIPNAGAHFDTDFATWSDKRQTLRPRADAILSHVSNGCVVGARCNHCAGRMCGYVTRLSVKQGIGRRGRDRTTDILASLSFRTPRRNACLYLRPRLQSSHSLRPYPCSVWPVSPALNAFLGANTPWNRARLRTCVGVQVDSHPVPLLEDTHSL